MENTICWVIGKKLDGNNEVLALIDNDHKVISVEYHPVFDKLYKKGSEFRVIADTRSGITKYRTDWADVYSQIYEEGIEYDFNAISIIEDEATYTKSILLKDEYGFEFRLKHPSINDLKLIGSSIKCIVDNISSEGLALSSTTDGKSVNQEYVKEQYRLFAKLHREKENDFVVLNKRGYRGIWDSIVNKYPDTAHFIYELLQNADDAKATEVSFILSKKSLIFKHNGTVHFTVTDDDKNPKIPGHINSITGIGDTTKLGDNATNKIGKFGVGFKSVFQYTDSPEIYDDLFKFRIINYIIPELIEKDLDCRNSGETLFYIPFKNSSIAYNDIHNKLRSLANGTLFLNNLKSIRWKNLVTGESKKYSKSVIESFRTYDDILAEKLVLKDYQDSKKLIMFSRIINLGTDGKHKIYVGYYLKDDGSIDTSVRPKVYCFFPTSESFGTCMITHAPFLLVDSRQQIKPGEKVNETLVNELGRLIADSLCALRDIGIKEGRMLLNENIEQIIDWKDYYKWRRDYRDSTESIIRKFVVQDRCIFKLSIEPLLLSSDGYYLKASQLYEVSPKSLASLLTCKQLKELRHEDRQVGILNEKLNELDFT